MNTITSRADVTVRFLLRETGDHNEGTARKVLTCDAFDYGRRIGISLSEFQKDFSHEALRGVAEVLPFSLSSV